MPAEKYLAAGSDGHAWEAVTADQPVRAGIQPADQGPEPQRRRHAGHLPKDQHGGVVVDQFPDREVT